MTEPRNKAAPTTGRVFISYRRSETAWAARAVFERLWREFPQRVFIDLESIALGADFAHIIDQHLEGCEAMLAVIGPTWLAELNDRLQHEETDFVRLEVARALLKNIPVVPVLMDRAPMPKQRELPDDIKALTRRNGLPIMADTFEAQMVRVVHEVGRVLKVVGAETTAPAPAPAVVAAPAQQATTREPWMHETGTDAHGRWADIKVRNVVQRMRWIEPGEFWMGSTEAERRRFGQDLSDDQKNRFDNEKPRHRVTLTRGYWLADTACTQALWQAITGDNPSHFAGAPDLPVENVSWDDIHTQFLPELRRLAGDDGFGLPTEAQWENACRSGTDTAYFFGDTITPAQANFDGNYPPPGGAKGPYREKTLSVKAFSANTWGLHQMHGNVWEWCQDGPRTYAGAPQTDPVGPSNAASRVLRGGSWNFLARILRAAGRNLYRPDVRFNYVGFRLCCSSPI